MKKLATILIVLSIALGLAQSKSFVQSGIAAPNHIAVVKTPNPPHVYEPGGLVNFTVTLTNGWNTAVTILSLIDDIHGDLNGQGTCSVPQTIPVGGSYTCTFPAQVNGKPGYSETDTVFASGKDADGNSFTNSATATVDVLDLPPVIAVTKTADPTQVNEPGGTVNFTVVVQNNSGVADPVTITSLVDDIHGNLNGQGSCSVPQTIQPGASYTCIFPAQVNGNAGHSEIDTVTASGTDDEGVAVSAKDDATVTVVNVLPVIAVTKTADPIQVYAPGGTVNFTVVVQNNSGTSDPVTITSLLDDIHGNLNGQGTCSVPQTIQPGASYTCTFPALVSGSAGHSETDTVTASGTDDEGTPVSAKDDATVTVIAKSFKVYFPIVSSGVNHNLDITVGYEDLPFGSPLMDFDYNDFVIDIHSLFTFDPEIKSNLRSVNFILTPDARGAVYDHEFHIAILSNLFASNGVATLTIFDQNHNVISSQPTTFVASSNNNFVIFPHTSDIFPTFTNTYETRPHLNPQRTAELRIDFNTPFFFDPSAFQLTDEHGSGMLFNPYIKVLNTGENIFQGDSRMLVIPDINWMWPEEHVRMDKAYPLTTYRTRSSSGCVIP